MLRFSIKSGLHTWRGYVGGALPCSALYVPDAEHTVTLIQRDVTVVAAIHEQKHPDDSTWDTKVVHTGSWGYYHDYRKWRHVDTGPSCSVSYDYATASDCYGAVPDVVARLCDGGFEVLFAAVWCPRHTNNMTFLWGATDWSQNRWGVDLARVAVGAYGSETSGLRCRVSSTAPSDAKYPSVTIPWEFPSRGIYSVRAVPISATHTEFAFRRYDTASDGVETLLSHVFATPTQGKPLGVPAWLGANGMHLGVYQSSEYLRQGALWVCGSAKLPNDAQRLKIMRWIHERYPVDPQWAELCLGINQNGNGMWVSNTVGAFEADQPWSVSVWVRRAYQANPWWSGWLASKWHSEGRGWGVWYDAATKRGQAWVQVSATERLAVEGLASIGDGQWHHLVVTYNGSKTPAGLKFYVDGAPCETNTLHDSLASGSILSSAWFCVGKRSDTGAATDEAPHVMIGQPCLFSRTLALGEAAALYNSGVPVDTRAAIGTTGLEGYWPINRREATNQRHYLDDISGHGRHGTYDTNGADCIPW